MKKSKVDTHGKPFPFAFRSYAPRYAIAFRNCTQITVSSAAGAVSGKRLSDGQFSSARTLTRQRTCQSPGNSSHPYSRRAVDYPSAAAVNLHIRILGCQSYPCRASLALPQVIFWDSRRLLCLSPELRRDYSRGLPRSKNSAEIVF
ncbi:hypothetical protein Acr_00g0091320 [Actinidia rufa]|uniref:Uncharacterized protein n=1 Tax=Actinidia rufa TaxID=165716 RepID=A0A7J0DZL2_9ERIC|nr:hypothetical protein Acr_00g0091320 [Actinidia rufa]